MIDGTATLELPNLTDMVDPWVKFPQIGEVTGMGNTFIQTEISSGRLPSIKVGRCRRVRLSDLKKWMASFNGAGEI